MLKLTWESAEKDPKLPKEIVAAKAAVQPPLKEIQRMIVAQAVAHRATEEIQETLHQENLKVTAAKAAGHRTTRVTMATVEMIRVIVETTGIKAVTAVKASKV